MNDGVPRIVIADVGARGGLHDRWRDCETYTLAFDPDAPPVEAFGVRSLPYALGRQSEERTFYHMRYAAASGLFPLTPLFSRFDAADDVAVVRTSTVRVVDFDTLATELGLPQPDVFAIDVQGAELDVLEGAVRHLPGALAVEAEVWLEPPHPDVPPFSRIDLFLRDRGFHLFDLSVQRYARRGHGTPLYELDGAFGQTPTGQVVWGDAVYLRDPVGDGRALDAVATAKLAAIMRAYGLSDCAAELEAWSRATNESSRTA